MDLVSYLLGKKAGSAFIKGTFTINGTEYTSYEGMTWEDWVNSDFNKNHTFCCDTDSNRVEDTAMQYPVYYVAENGYGVNVAIDDVIIAGKVYFCD